MAVSSLSQDQGQLGGGLGQGRCGWMSPYQSHRHSHTSFYFPALLQGSLSHWQGASSASPEARAKVKGAYCCSMSPFNPSQQFPWLLLDCALHQANARPRNGAKRLQLPSFCAAEEEKENDFSSALHIPFSSASYVSWEQGSTSSSKVSPRMPQLVHQFSTRGNWFCIIIKHKNLDMTLEQSASKTEVAQAGFASLLTDLLRSLFLKTACFLPAYQVGEDRRGGQLDGKENDNFARTAQWPW